MILTHIYSMCGVRGERQRLSGKPSVTFDRWLKRESGSTRTDVFTPADASRIWSGRRRIWPLTVRIHADRSLECTQTLTVGALTAQPCKSLAPFPPFINLDMTSKCVCVCGGMCDPSLICHLSWECVGWMLSRCVKPCPEVQCPCDRSASITTRG